MARSTRSRGTFIPFTAMRLRTVTLAAALAAAPLSPSAAQLVQGRLAEDGGAPVPQMLVVLLDTAGRQRAGAISGDDGAFVLRAPEGGRFTLRVERVGYASTVTPPFDLAPGETVERRIVVNGRPIALDAIVVDGGGSRGCAVRPGTGEQTATVWEEARKALNSAAYGEEHHLFRYRVARFQRDLDPSSGRVLHETSSEQGALAVHPFASPPAAQLSAHGWIQNTERGTLYFGPDPAVLVSDEFLDDHCLRIANDRAAAGDSLVGVAFEPVGGRRVPEIRGVLWLSRRTAELRRVEYTYTGLPPRIQSPRLGGTVEYARVAGGPWIVRRWSIRMPQVEVVRTGPALAASGHELDSGRLVGVREDGGEVISTLPPLGAPAARSTAIAGTVWDSAAAAPLAGARVFVSGTSLEAATDAAGRFRIETGAAGNFTVAFVAPKGLASAVPPRPATVTVAEGETAEVSLATPGVRTLAAALCPAAAGSGVVIGTVRGGAAAGARVRATWSESPRRTRTAEAVANDAGVYAFCAVPAGRALALSATVDGAPARASVTLAGAPLLQDLASDAALASGRAAGRPSTQTLALAPSSSRASPGSRPADGRPASGAAGTGSTEKQSADSRPADDVRSATDRRSAELASGSIEKRPADSRPADDARSATSSRSAELASGSTDKRSADSRPADDARARLAAFARRRRHGGGVFVTREWIDARHAARALDLFRALPGVEVVDDGEGGGMIRMSAPSARRAAAPMEMRRSTLPAADALPATIDAGACRVRFLVDGAPVASGDPAPETIAPERIEAMEIYRTASETPPELRDGDEPSCGTVVIWTRAGVHP